MVVLIAMVAGIAIAASSGIRPGGSPLIFYSGIVIVVVATAWQSWKLIKQRNH